MVSREIEDFTGVIDDVVQEEGDLDVEFHAVRGHQLAHWALPGAPGCLRVIPFLVQAR